MESSECEGTSVDMFKAPQKGNVYHKFMKGLNEDIWSVNYNEWSSEESDNQEDQEDLEDEIIYDIINEKHLQNIDIGNN
jgi:hypothetical protein